MVAATSFDNTLAQLGIKRSSTSPAVSPAASQTLGQSDFLALMTAQLKNQDPFSPVDNTQMVAQMAQFSSVAGISEMNTTLKSISDRLGASSATDAMAYVGKTVLTEGDTAFARTSGGIAGAVELDGAASGLTVSIADASGQSLRTLRLGAQKPGTVSYDWDGMTDRGEAAGNGPFTIAIAAQNAGKPVAARGLVWSPVQSVSLPASGAPILTLPGVGPVPITAVRQIG